MVLLEMLSGEVPFAHAPDLRVSSLVLGGEAPIDEDVCYGDAFCTELMQDCWHRDPSRRPSAAQLVQRIVSELMRECFVCYETFALSGGLECNSDDGTHFVCSECLADSMRFKLESNDVRAVPPEGYMLCGAKNCYGLLTVERLQEVVVPSLLVAWTGVSSANKLAQLELRASTRIRELEMEVRFLVFFERCLIQPTQATLGPVMRHVHAVTNTILTDSCPRCRTAFYGEIFARSISVIFSVCLDHSLQISPAALHCSALTAAVRAPFVGGVWRIVDPTRIVTSPNVATSLG
jgi:hypothetical protein